MGLTFVGRWLPGALAVLLLAADASAQVTVRSARLVADLAADDGGAEVVVEYALGLPSSAALRFELLAFGRATATKFWLGEERTGTPVALEGEGDAIRATELVLNLAGPADSLVLVARYRVEEAVEREGEAVRVHVPVLTVAAPPDVPGASGSSGEGGIFQAELLIPEGWRVSEGFPSGLRPEGDGRWSVDLAVVPSVVSLRGRSDGSWRPGLPLALDAAATAVLLLFGVLGWRQLQGVAAAGQLVGRDTEPGEAR